MTDDRICHVEGCSTPMPTGDNSTACPGHWNRLEQLLAETPAIVAELDTTITRQAHITLTSTGRRPAEPKEAHDGLGVHEQPLPFNLGASEALDLLHRTLWPWVREGLEAHPEMPTPSPGAVGLSRALLRLHGWLQGHPDGALAIDEITYAHQVARRAIDRGADLDYAGPCGAVLVVGCPGSLDCRCGCHDGHGNPCTEPGGCGLGARTETCPEDLYVAHDALVARCRTCGTEWDVPERRAALLEVARDRLVTTTEACRAVKTYGGEHLPEERIRQWKSRGRLVSHGHTYEPGRQRPVDLWRLGDILDLTAGVSS